MSVYRTFGKVPTNDLYAQRAKKPEGAEPTIPPAMTLERLRHDEAYRRERKGEPANVALPLTQAWAASLPRHIRVTALLRSYPRIANLLAADWNEPAAAGPYMHELMVDRRGNRQGFPPDVLVELAALLDHYAWLHPGTQASWHGTDKRR